MLEQAQEAVQQGNWSLLNRYLQQVLLSEETEQLFQTLGVEQLLSMALTVLEFGDFQDRWEIAKLVPVFGEVAIAPLRNLLQDDEVELEIRWFAARILGEYNHPVAIQALIEVLKSCQEEDLRAAAAEALANLGTPAIAALTDLLVAQETRLFAVRCLAQVRHSKTIEPLLGVVHDSDPAIRALAIEALGSFHNLQVPPTLVEALTDPVAAVRIAAIEGLGVRSDLAVDLALVNRLSSCLWDLNQRVCQQAAIALGRLGTDAAAQALFQVLQSPHTPLALELEVVRTLGWMGTAIALNYLQQVLSLSEKRELNPIVVQEMVTLLGRWQDPELKPDAAQILMDMLNSTQPAVSQPAVQQSIALGLGYLQQPQAFECLTQLLANDDIGVRLHAIAALKMLDHELTYQRLELLATQTDLPKALRQGVAIALQEWTTES
ncbi:MAG: HEAT repeat domain-containing protein [Kovacikia sp.]